MPNRAESDVQLRLAHLRDELREARQSLLEIIATDVPEPGEERAESDGSTQAAQHSEAASARMRQRRTLDELEAALQRFENGTYGICTGCGRSIPVERLEALPSASRCLECQYQQEISRPR